jgi:hypothetical protein
LQLAHTLNEDRRQMSLRDRRLARRERVRLSRELSAQGLSTRQIAAELGVGKTTVERDLAGDAFASPAPTDGPSGETNVSPAPSGRSASRPRSPRAIAAATPRSRTALGEFKRAWFNLSREERTAGLEAAGLVRPAAPAGSGWRNWSLTVK